MKIILLFGVALLAGCAAAPSIEKTAENFEKEVDQVLRDSNRAEIRLYRVDALMQKFVDFKVFIDGTESVSLSNSSAAKLSISPGKHVVHAKMGGLDGNSGCGFEVEVVGGEIIYASLSPSAAGTALPIISIFTNPIVCKVDFKPVSSNEGSVEYSKMQAGSK